MQQDRRKWLWWVAVGLWIATVFSFSTDHFSAEATSRYLGPLVRWMFPMLSAEAQQLVESMLRKAAHPFEYAVLAALSYRALRESSAVWRSAGFALALVFAVAVADETHQAFAVARTGSAIDVSIDVAGGAAALLLLTGTRRFVRTRRLRREDAG